MKIETIDVAIKEAERFLKKAKECKKAATKSRANAANAFVWYFSGKETASMKRSSMDLTRALADLRRA